MKHPIILAFLLSAFLSITPCNAALAQNTHNNAIAAHAVNELAIDLYRSLSKPNENLCLSPYSIQSALVMAFAGSAGETRTEMAKALHYESADDLLYDSFSSLQKGLLETVAESERNADSLKKLNITSDPVILRTANRLFGKSGYAFRESYLTLVENFAGGSFEPTDFSDREKVRGHINGWVEEQTNNRIKELIPPGGITESIRLLLVNALYFKASWSSKFDPELTESLPFHVNATKTIDVPTMHKQSHFGYAKEENYQVVSLPYEGNRLQLVVFVPDAIEGISSLEDTITAASLMRYVSLATSDVDFYLPKFKIESPTMPLGEALQALGMKQAFDEPLGSANFDSIAPRTPQEYLLISDVLHKTFFELNETGTEAAAATAVLAVAGSAFNPDPPKPIEVRTDRPFIYMIQDKKSGAVLFMGKVVEPKV